MTTTLGEFCESNLIDEGNQKATNLDLFREVSRLAEKKCLRPIETPTGDFVRCGSRVYAECPSCAAITAGDYREIMRSGFASGFRFFFVTLTQPSFGKVHDSTTDLVGTPKTPATYDYLGQADHNHNMGKLWTASVKRLRRFVAKVQPLTEESAAVEALGVYELQKRGALHIHALVRVPSWVSLPAEEIGEIMRSATAKSPATGAILEFGTQFDSQEIYLPDVPEKPSEKETRTHQRNRQIWYLSKMIGYSLKAVSAEAAGQFLHAMPPLPPTSAPPLDQHYWAIQNAYTRLYPPTSAKDSRYKTRLQRLGGGSHVVVKTRGWSLKGLTRKVQHEKRCEVARDLAAKEKDSITSKEAAEVDYNKIHEAILWVKENDPSGEIPDLALALALEIVFGLEGITPLRE